MLLLPDGEYDFEIVGCRVFQESVPQLPEGARSRVEFDLRCLTGPHAGVIVTDWTNLVNPSGKTILAAKLRKIGIRVPDTWGPEFLEQIGPDLRGLRVRIAVSRKTSVKGREYAYFFYQGLQTKAGPSHQQQPEAGGAGPDGPSDGAGDSGANCLSEAESKALDRLYGAPPVG